LGRSSALPPPIRQEQNRHHANARECVRNNVQRGRAKINDQKIRSRSSGDHRGDAKEQLLKNRLHSGGLTLGDCAPLQFA
jgi:hypothetical protein